MSSTNIQRILYPTAMGRHSRPIFRQAYTMAENYHAALILLHVLEPMGEMGRLVLEHYLNKRTLRHLREEGISEINGQIRARLKNYLDEEMNALGIDQPNGVNIELVVSDGQPEHIILQQTKLQYADLMIIGADNSFGQQSSLTHQIIQYSDVPVLVVPTGRSALKWRDRLR